MKLVSKPFFIEVVEDGASFLILTNDGPAMQQKRMTREYLLEYFKPVDCGTINIFDPNRDDRIANNS